ncbi:MAG: hypothetical protein AMXMBFR85_10230 [Dehalococcoides mccartyi]
MNRTKIEYLDYCWNFVTGCNNWRDPKICGGGGSQFKCWAKSMADRFGRSFEPTVHTNRMFEPFSVKTPGSRIGVCFTGDLFADDINPFEKKWLPIDDSGLVECSLRDSVISIVKGNPDQQFFFLTKCPWNLSKYDVFPDNAYVGISMTGGESFPDGYALITSLQVAQAKHKWISFEPLTNYIPSLLTLRAIQSVDYVVIGGFSNLSPHMQPTREAIDMIIFVAEKFDVPVFIKDNLRCRFPEAAGMWPGKYRERADKSTRSSAFRQ